MKRLIQLAVLISAAVLVLRRLGVSVAVGTVILDNIELSQHVSSPVDLNVFGMVTIPSGTSPDLVRSAIRNLRVFGLLEADSDAIKALADKATLFGATHSRDG